jgi:peptidoglycan L-alanyl-D-glutamate endopeptidase CwlK
MTAPRAWTRRWWVLLPIPMAGLPAAVVLACSGWCGPDPLQAGVLALEGRVGARLRQAEFLPPPPLPPALFAGNGSGLEAADRDWDKLDPAFTRAVLGLFNRCAERGYPLALLEGYRSPERQEVLARDGLRTQAGPYRSRHQFGLAADLAPVRDGVLLIEEREPWAKDAYRALGEEAEALGLVWGGRWSFRDLGHVEMPNRTID